MRILSIDGGGVRGLIPAMVLADLEARTGRRVHELFDLIAGTSTGGVLALALTSAGKEGLPATAQDLLGLYVEEGPKIFDRSVFDRIRSVEGAIDEKYPSAGVEEVLGRYFGDVRLRDALTPVMVTAYETRLRSPFFFRSQRAKDDPAYDYPVRDAARATSAAPTYFEPPLVTNDSSGEQWSLVDGGIFANSPAMCAMVDARRLFHADERQIVVLSLGTGEATEALEHARIKDWGALQWLRPVIDIIFDGVADVTSFQLGELLDPKHYWRLQTHLHNASDHLDDARPENLEHLALDARALIKRESAQLEVIAAALAA